MVGFVHFSNSFIPSEKYDNQQFTVLLDHPVGDPSATCSWPEIRQSFAILNDIFPLGVPLSVK